jgi:uncharacterized protein YbjT (DUF2867 family)
MTTAAPLHDADREAERKRADRLIAESFGPGSTLRSPEFIDGFRARLYFSFAGDPIVQPHPIGTPEADAFFSGIDYGRIVAHMQG